MLGCVFSFGVPGKEVGMPPWGRGKRGMPPRAGRGETSPHKRVSRGCLLVPRASGGMLPHAGQKEMGMPPRMGLGGGESPKAAKVSLLDASPNGKFCRGRMGFQQEGASGRKIITG